MQPRLAFAAAAAVTILIAVVVWSDFATPLVIAVVYSNAAVIAVTLHGVPYILGAAVLLLLVVPLINILVRGGSVLIMPAFPLMLLLLAAMIVSALLSVEPSVAWSKTQTFAMEGVILYFLVTNVVRTRAMVRTTIWVLLIVAALLGALSFYQQVTHSFGNDFFGFAQPSQAAFASGTDALGQATFQPRLGGVLGSNNYFAQIMLMIIPLGFFRFWSERTMRLRVLALVCTVFVSLGVVMTFSRGAVVGFVLMIVVMAVLRYISLRQIAAIVLGLVLLLAAFPQYRQRLATLDSVTGATASAGAAGAADNSVRSRATEGLAAALAFADHPIIGVGPGLFTAYYYQDYAPQIGIRTHAGPRGPHDLYVGLAAETGVLGLSIFLGIVFVTLLGLARARRAAIRGDDAEGANTVTAFMLAIVSYLTTGLFLGFAYERYFWLILALAAAATYVVRQTSATSRTA
ncbi:MAG TPA: O-antigen ligase family protein [Gaiellaceae bacterium]|nr:O-antigen ligase family protein [Gaiellaceae bacterium]